MATALINNCTIKPESPWRKPFKMSDKCCSRNEHKISFKHRPMGSKPDLPSLSTSRRKNKARRGALERHGVSEDKWNDPRYNRPKPRKREAPWRRTMIGKSDKFCQATLVTKSPGYSLAWPLIREQSRARGNSSQERTKRRRTYSFMDGGRKRRHASVHKRGVEAAVERTTNLIHFKFLGAGGLVP